MGTFINIGNAGFKRIRNSEYVDKSGLIAVVNSSLFTERCFSCVTRCRRFGKSMAAKMLCAYYDLTWKTQLEIVNQTLLSKSRRWGVGLFPTPLLSMRRHRYS